MQLPTIDDLGGRFVANPTDLGTHLSDAALATGTAVLAHLAAAMEDPAGVTAADLAVGRTPPFVRPPDPFDLFARELVKAPHAPSPNHELRVLTYNTALLNRTYLGARVEMPEYAVRREAMPDIVFGDGWDVLLLQEIWDDADLARFEAAAPNHGYRLWGGTTQRHRQHGCAIALKADIVADDGPDTRAEVQYAAQYRLERWPGPNIKRGWLSWRFRHAAAGVACHVFSTHMTAFPQYWRHRSRQARELGLHARTAAPDDVVIVGGDMNAAPYYAADTWTQPSGRLVHNWWRNTTSYALLRHYGQLEDIAIKAGMGATHPHDAYTATDKNSLCHRSYAGLESPARMDHLLLRDHGSHATVLSAARAYVDVMDFGAAGRFELSDHYGVSSVLALEPAN